MPLVMLTYMKAGFGLWLLLVFALLFLPFCAYAATENPDEPSAAPSTHIADGSIKNASETDARTISEKLMTMSTPASVLELIENLYKVHRSRIAFDEAFYTEENVRKITACKDTNIRVTSDQGKKELRTGPFDFRSITGDLGDDARLDIAVSILLTIKPDGKKSVDIDASFSRVYPSLYYSAIEKLVGNFWQRSKLRPLGSFEKYRSPTDIHGNNEMEYRRQDGDFLERGSFKFNPAGLLEIMILYMEEQ